MTFNSRYSHAWSLAPPFDYYNGKWLILPILVVGLVLLHRGHDRQIEKLVRKVEND